MKKMMLMISLANCFLVGCATTQTPPHQEERNPSAVAAPCPPQVHSYGYGRHFNCETTAP